MLLGSCLVLLLVRPWVSQAVCQGRVRRSLGGRRPGGARSCLGWLIVVFNLDDGAGIRLGRRMLRRRDASTEGDVEASLGIVFVEEELLEVEAGSLANDASGPVAWVAADDRRATIGLTSSFIAEAAVDLRGGGGKRRELPRRARVMTARMPLVRTSSFTWRWKFGAEQRDDDVVRSAMSAYNHLWLCWRTHSCHWHCRASTCRNARTPGRLAPLPCTCGRPCGTNSMGAELPCSRQRSRLRLERRETCRWCPRRR